MTGAVAAMAIPDLEAAVRDLIARDAAVIPPYPAVAMRLQAMVGGGSYGIHDLAKVAMTDPVVTASLLRTANSAAFGGSGKITGVSEAVGRLGAAEVVRIALGVSLGAEAGRRGPLAPVRRRVWQEALQGAIVSFHLANARKLNGQEGFVCGLLHDVGRVVAVSCLEALLIQHRDGRSHPEAEWLAYVDRFHVELGIATARKWGLPAAIQTAIASHHNPERAGDFRPMVEVIRAADAVVALLMTQSVITLETLIASANLPPEDALALSAIVPTIAPFIASLEEIAPAPAMPEGQSQVARPTSTRPTTTPEKRFPVRIMRSTGELQGECSRLTPTTLHLVARERLPEKYLVRLWIQAPDMPPFDVHAFIETSTPCPEGFEAEGRLFALSGAVKDAWTALLIRCGVIGPPPAATNRISGSFRAVGSAGSGGR